MTDTDPESEFDPDRAIEAPTESAAPVIIRCVGSLGGVGRVFLSVLPWMARLWLVIAIFLGLPEALSIAFPEWKIDFLPFAAWAI